MITPDISHPRRKIVGTGHCPVRLHCAWTAHCAVPTSFNKMGAPPLGVGFFISGKPPLDCQERKAPDLQEFVIQTVGTGHRPVLFDHTRTGPFTLFRIFNSALSLQLQIHNQNDVAYLKIGKRTQFPVTL